MGLRPDGGATDSSTYFKRSRGQICGEDNTRRVYPHLLRHSIAISMLRGGADIKHVQTLLGHASIETTKIYLRMVPGHLREEYDAAMPIIAVTNGTTFGTAIDTKPDTLR